MVFCQCHGKVTLLVSKRSIAARDSRLKLIRQIVSLLAVVMVLLLGAVSVHADETGHSHDVPVHISADSHSQADAVQPGHAHSDAVIHCGAPILTPAQIALGYSVRVASVAYYGQDASKPLDLAIQDLRPPRR